MGYLSQKKKYNNIKELLNLSLLALVACGLLLFIFPGADIAAWVSRRLFQIYIYALIIFVYALLSRFFWHAAGLFVISFILFLNIGMGGSLFFSVQTPGVQHLNIIYQSQSENLHDIEKQMKHHNVDVACLQRRPSRVFGGASSEFNFSASLEDKNMIITRHHIFRSGEVLLSAHNRAGFADIELGHMRVVFLTLDFSLSPKAENRIALKNLAEFINIQDIPVIVVGNFGIEAWAPTFLEFMEKTGLEVKNNIILSDGTKSFAPMAIPSINVLAYKDFGVRDISFLSAKHNSHKPLLIKLNY